MPFSPIGFDEQGDKENKNSSQVTGKDSQMDFSGIILENKYWILTGFCIQCACLWNMFMSYLLNDHVFQHIYCVYSIYPYING